MITAETLQGLTSFTTKDIVKILETSGYEGWQLKSVKFLGLTNGGQFCYGMVYDDRNGLGEQQGKVFVSLDNETGALTADY